MHDMTYTLQPALGSSGFAQLSVPEHTGQPPDNKRAYLDPRGNGGLGSIRFLWAVGDLLSFQMV